jgi:hypothetical protein
VSVFDAALSLGRVAIVAAEPVNSASPAPASGPASQHYGAAVIGEDEAVPWVPLRLRA